MPLDEMDHQALDLIESLAGPDLEAAVERSEIEASVIEAAVERARVLYSLTLAMHVGHFVRAAQVLVDNKHGPGDEGGLEATSLQRLRDGLIEHPNWGARLPFAVELTKSTLGIEAGGIGELCLDGFVRSAEREPVPDWVAATIVGVSERVAACGVAGDPGLALRVFRSGLVRGAGASVRARALAGGQAECRRLAEGLVGVIDEPEALVAAFDRELEVERGGGGGGGEERLGAEYQVDGPKRRFSWVHLVWAGVILGLTVWHYWLR